MRIALFTDTYPPFINGVSTSCYNLAKTLKEHGHDVLVVTPRTNDGPLEVVDGVVWVPGVELKKLYGYRLTKIFSSKVFEIVKKFNPQLIHNQTDSTIGQSAKIVARKLNVPIIYTYHTSYEDYTYYVTKGFFDRIAKRIVRKYSKGVVDKATELITPSEKTKEYVRFAGTDSYVNVIPTGIDFSLFSDDKFDKEKAEKFKEDNNIPKDAKIFLILGRIAKEKSMDFSIRGFATYKQEHPDKKNHLVIVGGGPQKFELETLVDELGIKQYVTFVGPVPASEVPFYYHMADIYTSASVTETQGLTFMEAMSSGTIVLARFDTNLSETIVDGKTGFFFTDEKEFVLKADRILNLTEDEINKIKEGAYKIVDIYSIDKFYQNIIGVYEHAIKKFW